MCSVIEKLVEVNDKTPNETERYDTRVAGGGAEAKAVTAETISQFNSVTESKKAASGIIVNLFFDRSNMSRCFKSQNIKGNSVMRLSERLTCFKWDNFEKECGILSIPIISGNVVSLLRLKLICFNKVNSPISSGNLRYPNYVEDVPMYVDSMEIRPVSFETISVLPSSWQSRNVVAIQNYPSSK
ncbi:hypothetical protein V1477_021268 [Vespula maculifrons]|uniref:Uncharacterized protein n=1 Tax=Vespula maculifrons TaxID=7453 RepID=A0ABD2AGN8_VESMC